MTNLILFLKKRWLRYHYNIRVQVWADNQDGGRYRFIGRAARQRAKALEAEANRRRLNFEWLD